VIKFITLLLNTHIFLIASLLVILQPLHPPPLAVPLLLPQLPRPQHPLKRRLMPLTVRRRIDNLFHNTDKSTPRLGKFEQFTALTLLTSLLMIRNITFVYAILNLKS
jgi:hypothetical protein